MLQVAGEAVSFADEERRAINAVRAKMPPTGIRRSLRLADRNRAGEMVPYAALGRLVTHGATDTNGGIRNSSPHVTGNKSTLTAMTRTTT